MFPSYLSLVRVSSENPVLTSAVPGPNLTRMFGFCKARAEFPYVAWTPWSDPEGSKPRLNVPERGLKSSLMVPSNVIATSSVDFGSVTVPIDSGLPPSNTTLPPELDIDADPMAAILEPCPISSV